MWTIWIKEAYSEKALISFWLHRDHLCCFGYTHVGRTEISHYYNIKPENYVNDVVLLSCLISLSSSSFSGRSRMTSRWRIRSSTGPSATYCITRETQRSRRRLKPNVSVCRCKQSLSPGGTSSSQRLPPPHSAAYGPCPPPPRASRNLALPPSAALNA